MIQRIQSLYLFAVAVLTGLMFINPVAVYKASTPSGELVLLNNMFDLSEGHADKLNVSILPLAIAAIAVILLSLVVIFMFKNRKVQLLLSKVLILLNVSLVAVLFFYVDFQLKCFTHDNPFSTTFLPGAYAPLVSLFLVYLAIRSINKDEELVRSADRLR